MKNRSIPYNWITCKLKDIGSFYRGKGISSQDIKDEGLPAIMYGDIYVKYNIKFKYTDHKIDEITATKSTKISKGTLLFTSSGETAIEIGKCVVYLGDEDIYIGGDIIALKPKECYNSLYLSYLLNSYPLVKQKARLGQGHSVVHIYPNILKELNLILPKDKEEQNKIANILSTWDNAIELKEKLIEQKKKQKKGLMQLLLTGKKRFGRFKEAWKPYKISNFLKESNKRVNDNDCIVASIGKFGLRHRDEVYDKELTKNYENYKLLPQNHIAYGLGSQSIDFGINLSDYDYCVSPAYKVFLIKNINGIFLYELLRVINPLYSFKYMITSARQGKSVDFIGYLNESIFVPNIEEQNAIANVLSTADKEIELLEKQLEELKKQKKGLMQLLLTGIVRVTD